MTLNNLATPDGLVVERLMEFLAALGQDAEITVRQTGMDNGRGRDVGGCGCLFQW
jgi:hypothetical protein